MSRFFILAGAPGAGKGTQASVLAQSLNLAHVASGDLFRENIDGGTELGTIAKTYMDRGELVPDDVTVRMVLDRLDRDDVAGGAVLDGFPRTIDQATALDQALGAAGKAIEATLYIEVSKAELLRRLGVRWICKTCQAPFHPVSDPDGVAGTCNRRRVPAFSPMDVSMRVDVCGEPLYQRSDDAIDTARNRLQVYFEQTMPLIDYYRSQGKLHHIDGEQTISKVGSQLLDAIQVRR